MGCRRRARTVVPGIRTLARSSRTAAPTGSAAAAAGRLRRQRGFDSSAVNGMEQRRDGALSDRSILDERLDFDVA
ncbi:hypothetical protein Scep_026534 [Stephania cephalantha]|uniref:Uncharacterized protein n=1 Tax=Stephania cephalantha TaxID=152367 RepID=A0AAP0EKB4_9MAGN